MTNPTTNTTDESRIADWIDAANAHDTDRFLAFFTADAVLDDPSVGDAFEGRARIGEYYTAYFLGYDTRTRLVSIEPDAETVHVVVDFTGSFPGGQTGGTFDIVFEGNRIAHVRADLL